jgi:subtilisin family serine protease
MKKIVATFLVAVMCIFTVIPVLVHGQDKEKAAPGVKNSAPKLKAKFRRGHPDKKIPDQYIVVFNNEVEDVEREAERIIVEHGGDRVQQKTYSNALKGFSVRMPEAQARKVAEDPRVEFVEEDQVVSLEATQTGATWGLDRIDQRDLPLDSTYTYNYTAAGVKAYIIDTGILASHSEFGGRVIAGYTAISDGNGTTDCNGHGTHVSGTVGGATYGVAKSVTLVPVRVLDCSGSGTTSGVIAGVDWVTSDHAAGTPAVANMSLGGGISSALDTAVNNSINDGVTYAIAAGNDGLDACNYSPARVTNAITVGATTSTDSRASYSNYGTCVDIFAPGSSITSAWYTSTTATNTISGTSMATPHVTGVAALYLQSNSTASPATVWAAIRDSSTPNKVVSAGTGSPNRLLYSLLTTGGGGGTTSQLLLNPGFESGNINWGADAGVITNSTGRTPRTGTWYAWLNGYGSSNTDYLYQDVTIPASATAATLNFYLKIDTAETTTTTAYDTLTVTVRNTSGTVLQTLATYSNLSATSGYTLRSFNLLAYKGQTIRIYFFGSEDSSLQTSFIIDDTSLNVTQ